MEGGCHCAEIRFSVRTSKRELLRCNCSMCTKRAYLHLILPNRQFTLVSGESSLSEYRFGTKVARHFFCRHCGITPYYVPRSHPDGVSVNFHCLDKSHELLKEFAIRDFDGANWEESVHTIR